MSTSVSPDLRRIWRGARVPLALLLLVFVTGLVLLLSRGDQTTGALEPGSYQPEGSRALAKLLGSERVDVRAVHTLADASGALENATLLVTQPDLVPPGELAELRKRSAHVVLVAPGPEVLKGLLPGVQAIGDGEVRTLAPACTVGAAVAAGDATMGGIRYHATDPGARLCYRDGGGAALVQVGDGHGTVTVLGTPAPLTNDRIADQGNAALAMRLLGQHPRVVWYLPSADDPALAGGKKSITDLIPAGWRFGALQAGIAVVLLALWRARRLGPVVTEPLPVVVRAAEAAEGRARLYRRGRAAGHAAETLREASRSRLRSVLGLPPDAGPAAVVETVSARSGRSGAEVGAVLYGPPPADDPALVRLADELDKLESEVERL
ncbi:DUF4350 domain-containing protein [Amycolatopsis sp. NPDC059021]|uniref:DUF4350 domain-containing protein n=1 Tax=Amycolatopsis sp. NPDC059021 TaxID=3346704 RepID=UPI0036713AF3